MTMIKDVCSKCGEHYYPHRGHLCGGKYKGHVITEDYGAIMHEMKTSREERRFQAAVAAMQGLLASEDTSYNIRAIAYEAVNLANALLAELEGSNDRS